YVLDGVGNRRSVDRTTSAGTTTESYSVNSVNEYTVARGSPLTHDQNGNLTVDGAKSLVWDAFNRLVGVIKSGTPLASYEYLSDGRRAKKTVFKPNGQVDQVTVFLWDGSQEVEETNESGGTLATFVWSPVYVDELVQYERGGRGYFVHQDARANVV